ncbi:MAG TPA: hypothetical protein VNW52_02740, partial [Burkholderiaceae bacterium]|nr:hypothetical protein [Burkholderiaceae bacterium]
MFHGKHIKVQISLVFNRIIASWGFPNEGIETLTRGLRHAGKFTLQFDIPDRPGFLICRGAESLIEFRGRFMT